MQDPYKTLGISRSASADEIKKAYKKMARTYHPDRNPSAEAEARFKDVNAAYDVLGDPQKKKMFDTFGTTSGPSGFPGGGARGPGGFGFEGNPFAGDGFRDVKFDMGGGFEDLLGSMFGASGPNQRRRGADQTTHITIDYKTMLLGGEQTLTLNRPDGSTDRIKVKIPPGIKSGSKLRLKGQGSPPPGGGPCGDLHIVVQYQNHPIIRRVGKGDLEIDVPVRIREALTGNVITVPTPTGDVKVTVPAGVGTGCRLRLKGRGVQTNPPGDLYLQIRVAAPTTDDPAALAAAEALEAYYDGDVRQSLRDSI